MDTCKKCSQKFNFWSVYKDYWVTKQQVECTNCNAQHNPKFVNKILTGVVIIISVFVHSFLIETYELTFFSGLLMYTLLIAFIGLITAVLINNFFKFKLSEK
jgi:CXXC-20-CXXC protein